MSTFMRVAWLIVRKDVAVEVRSWELVSTTVFFAFACILVFAFAFVEEGRVVTNVSAGGFSCRPFFMPGRGWLSWCGRRSCTSRPARLARSRRDR